MIIPRRKQEEKTPPRLGPVRFSSGSHFRNWLTGCYIVFQSLLLVIFHLNLTNIDIRPDSWLREFFPKASRIRVRRRYDLRSDGGEKEAAFSYVRSFEKIDRPLVFFHIPKTAGTAIEFAGGKGETPWGSCLFNHRPKRDICDYPPGKEWPQHIGWWHLPRQFFPLAGADPYQGGELFAVVRDPYERMVSEFYYICTLKVFDWRPDQCDRSKLFEKDYMNAWLRNKLRGRERDSAFAYLSDNGHFTPQYQFIVAPNQVRMVDHVLRLDVSLSDQFTRLVQAFGLGKLRMRKLNALGAEERDTSKRTHLGADQLDAETLSWIHRLYNNDFDLGYERREVVTVD